ncbi:MAG: NADH-quinone oxidoreductase subunit C [Dehalococcoidales bacterium]|nr:NADH-quinone oxidoreductase subunit C [Dehalococcoidales bacterium]
MNTLGTILKQTLEARNITCQLRQEDGNECYVCIGQEAFTETMQLLINQQWAELIGLWAVENFEAYSGFTLFYCFENRSMSELLLLEVRLKDKQAISLALDFPIACYFEREVRDGFGIEFEGAFDTRRLFLHEAYPDDFHPLLKSFKNRTLELKPEEQKGTDYVFKECKGEGMYQIPVGPVHAGVIESGHFRFGVMGETIFNLEIRHFYKHRGLEKLAENRKPVECVAIAESISGDESACNATAFSMAIEDINDCTVPKRAWEIRTILLEMERIYSHLGDMAGMQVDVAYPIGASPLFILREEILRYNAILTGSRFLKGMIIPGGLKQNIPFDKLKALNEYMVVFTERFEEAVKTADESSWVIDRFETTGIVSNKLIAPLNLTGPVARASGACIDTRHDHPYGIYSRLEIEIPVKQDGDVLSRFQVKAAEICNSIEIIRDIIKQIHQSEIYTPCLNKDGYALAVVEAPRGQNIHWVYVKNGLIDRYKVRTASFCNWLAIEHAVLGNIVPDFPVINKSMNLSYAGNDL